MAVLPVVTTSSTRITWWPDHLARIRGKGSAQVDGARPAIEPDLRGRCANPAQRLPVELEVQQAGHDACDFVRLVEAPLDEAGRVQWHGYDQCRARPAVAGLADCMRSQSRAEDSRIRESALVLEGLHQVRDRKLVDPRRHAPEVRQVERVAALAAVRGRAGACGRGRPQRSQGYGTTGISASQSVHRSNAGRWPGRRHRTHRGGNTHPIQRSNSV